jgi:hypothetical protein
MNNKNVLASTFQKSCCGAKILCKVPKEMGVIGFVFVMIYAFKHEVEE